MHPAQAQRAEGDNPGRGREAALDSRDSRGGPAVFTEVMAKASSPCQRQGEEGREGRETLAGVSQDADLHKLPLEEKRGKLK